MPSTTRHLRKTAVLGMLVALLLGGALASAPPAHAFEIIEGMYLPLQSPGRVLDTRLGIGALPGPSGMAPNARSPSLARGACPPAPPQHRSS